MGRFKHKKCRYCKSKANKRIYVGEYGPGFGPYIYHCADCKKDAGLEASGVQRERTDTSQSEAEFQLNIK
jgi:hypothetical protein